MTPVKNTDVFYLEDHFLRSHFVTEIYVPDKYLETSKFNENGTTLTTIGILPYSVIQEGKITFSGTLKIAQIITLIISKKREDKVKLSKYSEEPEPVTVLLYEPGENITSEYTEANAELTAIIMDLLLGGKFPPNIPYQDILRYIRESFENNKVNLPIPSYLVEDMIATLYRSNRNPDLKFAYEIGKNPSINPLDYHAMSARDVTRHISTFAGISSERMGEALVYGVKRAKEGKKEPDNPIEKTIYA